MAETYNELIRQLVSEVKKLRDKVQDIDTRLYSFECSKNGNINLNSKISDTKSISSGTLNDVFTVGSEAIEDERENKLMVDTSKAYCINIHKRTGPLGLVKSENSGEFISKYDY